MNGQINSLTAAMMNLQDQRTEAENVARTSNGAVVYKTAGDANLEMFSKAGSLLRDPQAIVELFKQALISNPALAIRNLQYLRDIREGNGVRDGFRAAMNYYASTLTTADIEPAHLALINMIPEIGRYDDLQALRGTVLWDAAAFVWLDAIFNKKNALAAKWTPRKGVIAKDLRKVLTDLRGEKVNEEHWRKALVELSDTVEQKITAGEYFNIDYSKLPSKAMLRYTNLFEKRDSKGYAKYLQALAKGETKVNAGAVFPHEIVNRIRQSDISTNLAEGMWNSLPDLGVTENILPIVDVSGSMMTRVAGNISAMDVAVSLSIYASERINGKFKDHFITFSERPTLVKLTGNNIVQRVQNLCRADWGFNTNFKAALELVLKAGKAHNLPQSEMPSKLLVISDMQFDIASTGNHKQYLTVMRELFEEAGYTMPEIVFWNVNGRTGTSIATAKSDGVAMISGFSAHAIKPVLNDEDIPEPPKIDPVQVMMKALMKERYDLNDLGVLTQFK